MLTQEEIDDWYFDTPITRPINPAKEPVDYAKLIEESQHRFPVIHKALIERGD